MATKNNAFLPNLDAIIGLGFDPKTGLPLKMTGAEGYNLKSKLLNSFTVMDRCQAISRYSWYNLPKGLTPELIETILYYKGQGAFFYIDTNETFYFLPFALNGQLDCYGRYTGITPLAFAGGSKDDKDFKPFIEGLTKKPIYEPIPSDELDLKTFMDGCVILKDYNSGISQAITPRSILQQPLVDVMSDCIPFMRTSLISNTGIVGMRVGSEDELTNVKAASQSLARSAMVGEPFVPIIGQLDFQPLTGTGGAQTQEFSAAYQSLNNLRLNLLGVSANGVYEKSSHMLQDEQNMNASNAALIAQEGLTLREDFANIVNSIWGLAISVSQSEVVSGIDKDLDGDLNDSRLETNENPITNTNTSEEDSIDE